jgi:hypothetical protein
VDAAQALVLEALVADGQHLVDEQDVGAHVDGCGERQAHVHTGGVELDGDIDKALELGKGYDLVKATRHLAAAQAEHRAVQEDVLRPVSSG